MHSYIDIDFVTQRLLESIPSESKLCIALDEMFNGGRMHVSHLYQLLSIPLLKKGMGVKMF